MSGPALSRLNVLMVDDNRHMLMILRAILQGVGIREIVECVDSADAFEICRDRAIDLILLDHRVQPLDGIEFTRLMRNAPDSPNVFMPIILITAHTERRRVEEARDAGINEFLAKPVKPKDLIARIQSIILNPRPFVRTLSYFGPDRRRRQDPSYKGPERRSKPAGDVLLSASGAGKIVV